MEFMKMEPEFVMVPSLDVKIELNSDDEPAQEQNVMQLVPMETNLVFLPNLKVEGNSEYADYNSDISQGQDCVKYEINIEEHSIDPGNQEETRNVASPAAVPVGKPVTHWRDRNVGKNDKLGEHSGANTGNRCDVCGKQISQNKDVMCHW